MSENPMSELFVNRSKQLLLREQYRLKEMVQALEDTTKFLIGERDALYDGITDCLGRVADPDDAAALADYDQIIDRNRALLREIYGEGE